MLKCYCSVIMIGDQENFILINLLCYLSWLPKEHPFILLVFQVITTKKPKENVVQIKSIVQGISLCVFVSNYMHLILNALSYTYKPTCLRHMDPTHSMVNTEYHVDILKSLYFFTSSYPFPESFPVLRIN